jgi:uncharacterized protein YkwD
MSNSELDFEKLSSHIIEEHNVIRTNPKYYIPILRTYIKFFQGNILHRPSGLIVITNEGYKAFAEAVEFLENINPVGQLVNDVRINLACREYVEKLGIDDSIDDKVSSMADRIENYAEWEGILSQCVDFGSNNAVDVIINILVDDGVASRIHRKALFAPEAKIIGCSSGKHYKFGVVSVINYLGGTSDLNYPLIDYGSISINGSVKLNYGKNQYIKDNHHLKDKIQPEDFISVNISKIEENSNEGIRLILRKIYTLKNGETKTVDEIIS